MMKKGDIVKYKCGKLSFDVKILEHKPSFGRNRYLVKPIKGEGETVIEFNDKD